jgi:hypothetical protein
MTRIISISVLAAAVCSCAATQVLRDLSPQVAERGGQQDSRSDHMKIYMVGTIIAAKPESSFGCDILPRDSSLSRAVARIPLAHQHII